MRLLHAADLHLIANRHGDRTADFEAMLARIAHDAASCDVAAVLLAGDTFDSRRPGPDALRLFAAFLHGLKDRRVIVLPGNHDGKTTIGDPDSDALLWLQRLELPNVHVVLQPSWSRVDTAQGPLDLFALPYPHKRSLDNVLGDVPVDERATIVGQRVENIIEAYTDLLARKDRPKRDTPTVFLGHVSTLGARLGSEAMMKMGWDAAIDPAVLAPFDAALLGHIHRQQQIAPNAWYAGSPLRLDFGDLAGDKGWLLVDVEAGQLPKVTPLPANGRPMIDVPAEAAAGIVNLHPPEVDWSLGPIVRLVIRGTERPKAVDLNAAVRWLRDQGATYIKTEVRLERPVGEGAKTEVDPEANTLDALAAWLEANGHPAEPTMAVGRTLLASLDA